MEKEFKNLGRDIVDSKHEAINQKDSFRLQQLDDIHMEDPNEDEASYKEEREEYTRESNQLPAEGNLY